jgi:PHD and RING finger domain-containing protein 1
MSASTEFDSECPICLNILIDGAEIGSPDVCTHRFCLLCIIEWSRNTNTCPIDRSIFREILVKDTIGGNVVRRVPVEDKRPDDDEDDDDRTECEICGQSDREDRMLLCDHCDNG